MVRTAISLRQRIILAGCIVLSLWTTLLSADSTKATEELQYLAQSYRTLEPQKLQSWIDSFAVPEEGLPKVISIKEPLAKTLLPKEISSISFSWQDPEKSSVWMITISRKKEVLVKALVDTAQWIPSQELWSALKKKAGQAELQATVSGIGGWTGREIVSQGITSLQFSEDEVGAFLMFMRKPLPFLNAKKNPQQTQMLVGDLASYQQPRMVMSNIPVCANCHSYSLDGSAMTIDMDYAGNKGAFTYNRLQDSTQIDTSDVFSWNSLPVNKPAAYNMGLFTKLSPQAKYLAGTVNESSVFVMMDDIRFSQLFFPATGQLAIFDVAKNRFFPLPGASESDRVQTSPEWSPDGKTLAFSSVPVSDELVKKIEDKTVLHESSQQTIAELNARYPVQFDIYTVPFNGGAGGTATPLEGASRNGKSNYFPRYSPDGRWIVFTQSPTGLVLQPDSLLSIVPAAGGEARPLVSNQPIMNSWHSWSPNSRWLVFTCKANSPYTELYLTHIDDHGNASPAIRLFRFSHDQMAAMVPEFVPPKAIIPQEIKLVSPEKSLGTNMAVDGR